MPLMGGKTSEKCYYMGAELACSPKASSPIEFGWTLDALSHLTYTTTGSKVHEES